ncbi:MAG: hypothetical protein ACD_69C00043G0002 [uncultured bacterium]|nr:MAG: hypothetical protein ACD_69C00043G0002 [uncultured bacterium]HBC71871.1 hypothetical protein [Coxiellaceae bacterium]HBS51441.1 hypothetical protein [Coxiellaceae bacterium]HBY55723.1 hypothetical protein [Coxiellaceae bacterium]
MSKRIPAKLKAQLGEYLAEWYRHFGKVAPRRAYHEDDEGKGGDTSAKPMFFEGHPLLSEMPIGASSDLASILVSDERTLDEADKRSDELTEELQNKLALELGQKQQKRYTYQIKPQPF